MLHSFSKRQELFPSGQLVLLTAIIMENDYIQLCFQGRVLHFEPCNAT